MDISGGVGSQIAFLVIVTKTCPKQTQRYYRDYDKRERVGVFMRIKSLQIFRLKNFIILVITTTILTSIIFSPQGFLQESFAQYMGNVGGDNSDANTTTSYPPPLKQLKDGFHPNDITCNDDLELLIKNNGIPVCVTFDTKSILMERFGWMEPDVSSSDKTNQDKTSIEKFPYKIGKEMFANDLKSSSTNEEMIKFSSPSEIFDFLKDAQKFREGIRQFDTVDLWVSSDEQSSSGGFMGNVGEGSYTLEEALELQRRSIEAGPAHGSALSFDNTRQADYSSTNIQVDLVDEPDYIKTDGRYIYLVNQNTLTIIDAHPAETAKIVHKVAMDIESQDLENIFLNDDRLVILYHSSTQPEIISEENNDVSSSIVEPYPIHHSNTVVSIIDISDKQDLEILSEYKIDGNYHDARMIGDIMYLIADIRVNYNNPVIPRVVSTPENTVLMPDVYRFPNHETRYNFNTIAAIDVSSNSLINSETFLMGNSNTIYVSEDNLYITYQRSITSKTIEEIQREVFFDNILPLLSPSIQEQVTTIYNDPGLTSSQKQDQVSEIIQESYNLMTKQDREELFVMMQEAVKESEWYVQRDMIQTTIHKIALDNGNMTYISNADVPGQLLNQFSMDENNGKFRIATTVENNFRQNNFDDEDDTSNNVYILDEDLNELGNLEDIAPGEQIYSARFMGDQLYLVTFKQIDPFFVIDLSENTPKVLGELKIPGFSNYLQAYDDSHIIGIGRDTIENKDGGVQTEGIKISMFDVSDFENPKEKDTIVIGDSRTHSDILYNHKALLLDKQKDVMSIPIMSSSAALDMITDSEEEDAVPYREEVDWHGFYIYGFDENGFTEKGTIKHYQNHPPGSHMQPRSLYIDDVLYTVMDGSMKINDLLNVSKEINSIILANTGKLIEFVN